MVAVKRSVVGLRFGKTSYNRYAEELSVVLKMTLLITKLAQFVGNTKDFDHRFLIETIEQTSESVENLLNRNAYINNAKEKLEETKALEMEMMTDSQQLKINQLLGEWEEIEFSDNDGEQPSLSSIVQFRASIGILDSEYPFSHAFGRAKTRLEVIDCSQNNLNKNLMEIQKLGSTAFKNSPVLKFHIITISVLNKRRLLDQKQVQELMTMFRPARNGDISIIEFCKSIDIVFREMRKVRARIANVPLPSKF